MIERGMLEEIDPAARPPAGDPAHRRFDDLIADDQEQAMGHQSPTTALAAETGRQNGYGR